MDWKGVGSWLKDNGGGLLGLAGAVATGNIPAGIAAVTSMVTEATGESSPGTALAKLQSDPATMIRLAEIAQASETDIRSHHREMLRLEFEDAQKEHEQQQVTIRSGDAAEDEYVRHTRPLMARQSWYATMGYVIAFEGLFLAGKFSSGASLELGMLLVAPASAYLGFRTLDKFTKAKSADKTTALVNAVRRVSQR